MENIKGNECTDSLLYKKRREFRYFEAINQKSFTKIDGAIKTFYDRLSAQTSVRMLNKADLFENALAYLNSNFYLTNDEKIIFLILLIDPTLSLLSFYTKLVESEENETVSMLSLSQDKIQELKDYFIKNFGFYDPMLIKYEDFYKRIILARENNNKTTGLRMNYVDILTKTLNINNISLEIDASEIDEIIEDAKEYLKKYPKPTLNDLIFQLLYESGELDFEKLRNKLIFIIFVLDMDLRYKQVYDANYNLVTIRKSISQIFGCYYDLLMKLENKFIKDNFDDQYVLQEMKKPNYC